MLAISGTHVANFCRDRFVRKNRLRKSRKCTGSSTMVFAHALPVTQRSLNDVTQIDLKNPRDCFIIGEI